MGGERAPNRELFLLCVAELSRPVIVAHPNCRCPLWVKSRHSRCNKSCPLYPRKRTLALHKSMSALCQKPTYAPQQTASLFDHLVGKADEREAEAKCLGGLKIDRQIELSWLDDWQRGRLLALENPSDVDAYLTPGVTPAGTITNQSSSDRELSQLGDRRDRVADRQCGKLLALGIEKYVLDDNQRACFQFVQLCKNRIEIALGAGTQDMDL